MTLQPHIYSNLGYDPFVDLVPVSQTVKASLALAITRQIPARSTKEMIAWFAGQILIKHCMALPALARRRISPVSSLLDFPI